MEAEITTMLGDFANTVFTIGALVIMVIIPLIVIGIIFKMLGITVGYTYMSKQVTYVPKHVILFGKRRGPKPGGESSKPIVSSGGSSDGPPAGHPASIR